MKQLDFAYCIGGSGLPLQFSEMTEMLMFENYARSLIWLCETSSSSNWVNACSLLKFEMRLYEISSRISVLSIGRVPSEETLL